ncbi:MAG: hypothetical protein JJT76_01215 [Clostridiaceae bacterium]|nr:hypothetical protein [Clostridiaceae bacterium]
MKLIYKHMIAFCTLVIIITGFSQMLGNKNLQDKIKIAVGDDISGVVFDYMIEVKGIEDAVMQKGFESYPIQDCCSNTTQWALASGALDIAILCPNAAEVLIEMDDSFMVVGPVILNSDIFVVKEGKVPKKIGITQNRHYQEILAKKKFGEEIEIVPMITTALPYTYEKDMVDAVVIDVLRGLKMDGIKKATADVKTQPSYVLVVQEEFYGEDQYHYFMDVLGETVDEIEDTNTFLGVIKKFQEIDFTQEEVKTWQLMKTKFIHPEKK